MSALVVPLALDALSLDHGRHVVGALTAYDTLPWFDGHRDRFPTTPNLASAVSTEPFADHDLWLDAGVHLHWAIPAGLTRGSTTPIDGWVDVDGLWLPPTPNRWLVARIDHAAIRGWLVESDYVHPDVELPGSGLRRPIAFPRSQPGQGQGRRPYVRLGRSTDLTRGTWREESSDHPERFLPAVDRPLTALGPGAPTFAALYGNCHSVFGLHDPEPVTIPTQYVVVGWYAGSGLDPLSRFAATAIRTMPSAEVLERVNRERADAGQPLLTQDTTLTDDLRTVARAQALRERFGWTWAPAKGADFPSTLLCVGRLLIDPGRPDPALDAGDVITAPVAVGSTAGEALAALLAEDLHGVVTDGTSQDELETQLAALQLGPLDHGVLLDLDGSLAEQRHSLQFRETDRRHVWTVRHGKAPPSPGSPGSPGDSTALDLPEGLAHDLNVLNLLQEEYDRAHDRIDTARQSVFEDWHRYLTAAYPRDDVDGTDLDLEALVDLIETQGLAPLEALVERTGTLTFTRDPQTGRWSVSGGTGDTSATRLAAQIAAVSHRLDALVAAGKPPLELGRAPGSRFWRPRDPVVLFRHDHVQPDRDPALPVMHRQRGGPVDCDQLDVTPPTLLPRMPTLLGPAEAWQSAAGFPLYHFRMGEQRRQSRRSWNPLLLEWEVEVRPIAAGSNHDGSHSGYDPGFVTDHHYLAEGAPDLTARDATPRRAGFDYVSGRTALSAHATDLLGAQVAAAVQRLETDGKAVPPSLAAVAAAVRAGTYDGVISQSLGGFGDALVMRRGERQLAVADPLGFAPQRDLADRVSRAVAGAHPLTPRPADPFHPIQSGELLVQRLRIIDTFGQTVQWRPSRLVPAASYRPAAGVASGPPDRVTLPPRLAQAARLNLRWWSAGHDDLEMNDHPATSPVCGWFLSNELDGEVHVYDGAGRMLGLVDQDGGWQPAPAAARPITHPAGIPDRHLRRAVAWLTAGRDPVLVAAFRTTVDAALDAIDPLDIAQHSARALLVGRPVALARASIGFELHGPPMTDLSWPALRRRLLAADAGTTVRGEGGVDGGADHDVTAVRFPIRLGEHQRLGDGLVGYWLEAADGSLSEQFTAPQTPPVGTVPDPRIVTAGAGAGARADEPVTLELTLSDPERTLLLLVDPRGAVHATSGILPVERIEVPITHYAPALATMRSTFRAMPVLTPADRVSVPLPLEPGLSWSWLQPVGSSWLEVPEHPTVLAASFAAATPGRADAVWNDLVARGVIEPLDDAPDRGRLHLDAPDAALTPEELHLLNSLAVAIAPAPLTADFGTTSVVREGWLQLRPTAKGDGR